MQFKNNYERNKNRKMQAYKHKDNPSENISSYCEKLCMKVDTLGRCIKGYIIHLCISMRKMYHIQLNANFKHTYHSSKH